MKIKFYLFLLIFIFNAYTGAFVTMVMPSADRMARLLMFGGDCIIIALALMSLFKNRSFYGAKYFAVFLLISTLTFIYNSDRIGLVSHLNGLREPLFFLSSLVVVYDLFQSTEKDRFIRWFTAILLIFAVSESPLSIYQFLMYGSGDSVGGTYGTGGGSGIVTLLLFLLTFYFIVKFASQQDGSNFSVIKTIWFFPLLIPCGLNETKISFILLPMFLLLLMISRKKAYKAIPFLAFGLLLLYMLNHYYSQTVEDTHDILDTNFMEKYLLSNPTERGGDLPRFQRLTIMFRLMRGDLGYLLLGLGYGLFGGGNILGVSQVSRSLSYLQGSRILLFTYWIQGGLLLVLQMLGVMFTYLRSQWITSSTLKRFAYYMALVFLAIWAYNEAMLDRVFAAVSAYLIVWTSNGGNDEEENESAEVPVT